MDSNLSSGYSAPWESIGSQIWNSEDDYVEVPSLINLFNIYVSLYS